MKYFLVIWKNTYALFHDNATYNDGKYKHMEDYYERSYFCQASSVSISTRTQKDLSGVLVEKIQLS